MSVQTAPPVAAPVRPPVKNLSLLLVAVFGGMFLALLDSTIVGTALPRIVDELGGASLYTWTVTAYLLASTITVPIYGRLSDVYGRKFLLVTGLGLVLLGSALGAWSPDMVWLIAFRALQGLGAGALIPLALALAADLIPAEKMGKMQGLMGVMMGASMIGGPYLGGVLTDNVSWHWIFLINLPAGALILAVMLWALPASTRDRSVKVRVDYAGIVVFALAISGLLIGLTQKSAVEAGTGQTRAWSDWQVAGPLAAAAVLLVAFVLIERKVAEPLIPLGMFRNRAYTTFNVASFFGAFGMMTAMVFLPRFFQTAHGVSATDSGLRVYPMMIGMVVGSMGASVLITRTFRYKALLAGSAVLLVAGTVLFGQLEHGTSALETGIWMAVIGLGVGPMLSGLTIAVQGTVEPRHIGLATGKLSFFRQIGGSVALALAGTLYIQDVEDAAPVRGLAEAASGATGSVLAWVGGIGAAVMLLALLAAPGGKLTLRR
ncbi:MAG TPA: MFS transporter [Phytomonospora sp.]